MLKPERPQQAPDRAADEPPLTEPEIVTAAVRMQLADGTGAGVRLLPRLLDPQLTLGALSRLLEAEPALAIRVLRVANAPYYGQAGNVATLERATQLLGLDALRGVAAAACFDGMHASAWRPQGLDLQAFKRHSLASGVAARALAQRVAPDLAEQALMAGVLHDMGLLLLWRLRPATMAARAVRCALAPDGPAAALAGTAGMHHADCGRLLMQTWSLPPALCSAIAEHEPDGDPPPTTTSPSLAALLRAGHALAIEAGFGLDDDAVAPARAQPAGREGAWAELAASLPEDMQRLVTAFTH